MKSRTYYILACILISFLFFSCSENNRSKPIEPSEREITEDSILNLINSFKVNSPDTFIFLNYWFGMPKEFIDVVNTINSKQGDIVVYGSDSLFYYVFENASKIFASIAFLTNDSTQTLEAIELLNVWWISRDKPKGGFGTNFFFSDKIEMYTSSEGVHKEVTELYNYLEFLFGKAIQTEFDTDLYSLLHANHNKTSGSHFTIHKSLGNYCKTEYPPEKNFLWIDNKRYIQSICTNTNVINEIAKVEHVIGTKIENRIIFTNIEFINLLKEYNSKNVNLMKRKKLQLQQKQRKTI